VTVREALAGAVRRLAAAGVPQPERDARWLVAYALGVDRDRLTLMLDEPFASRDVLAGMLDRRAVRQPVAQIVGWREFWGRRFRVTPDVLDPRPETETLVEAALRQSFANALDLGVGSGCILLTLMAERPGVAGTGIDVSETALAVARRNADDLGLAPTLRRSDWYTAIRGRWDLIVSNPPYIGAAEMPSLHPDLAWEPAVALTPGPDPLAAYRRIAEGAARHLAANGRLLVEVGADQARPVAAIFADAGLGDVAYHHDLDGRERVVEAQRP
jgi:release factor glutamine methyltransferase